MAVSPSKIAVVTGLAIISLAHVALAWQDTSLCLGSGCNDCPAYTTNSGNGWPTCRIYNTAGFYDGTGGDLEDDFPEADDGAGIEVWFDIQEPDPDCAMIIKSPAGTQQPGCGQNILTAYNAGCARVVLANTFMLQWCCGNSDCGAAGAGKRDTFALGENGIAQRQAGGSHGSVIMRYGNGTEIPIVEEGYSPEDLYMQSRSAHPNRSLGQSKSRAGGSTIPSLKKRDCTFTPDGESYTRPGSTRTIEGPETGPVTVAVSSSETVGYTTSVSVGVAFEVFSAGVDFSTEQSFTETISRDFEVPAGQQGYIVWTPIYRCVDGHLSDCDDDDGEVRFCTAATTDAGNLSGSWAFQQRI